MTDQTVIADGNEDRMGCPDPHGRRHRPARRCFPPHCGRHLSVVLSHGPYAKGLSFQEGFKGNWDRIVAALSRDQWRHHQQVPELGTGGPREMGAGRLCVVSVWTPGAPAARPVSWTAGRPRDARSLRMRGVGGHAALVQRKGRDNGISYYAMNQWHVAALQPPRTSPPSVCGKAHMIIIGNLRATAASPALPQRVVQPSRSPGCSHWGLAIAGSGSRSPARRSQARPPCGSGYWRKNRVDPGIEVLAAR